jgi:hypothetical protein
MLDDLEYNAPIGKSHHSVLTFTFQCYISPNLVTREFYQYHKGNYDGLRAHLGSMDWETKLQNKSTEETWTTIRSTILEAQRKYIPRKTVKGVEAKKKNPLWMNDKALTKVKKKHEAWKRYMKTREGADYQEYCRTRNQAKWATRQAVKQFEAGIAKDAKANPSRFYKYVRSKTNTKAGIGNLTVNGQEAQSDTEKADMLNSFFSSVFTNEDKGELPEFEEREFTTILDNIYFTPIDVQKILARQNPNKAPGPDKIHPRLLRELNKELAVPLTTLFSLSIKEGTVPSLWKQAQITPIFKKGSKKDPGNYRPVSLTPIICKVMERLVKDKVLQHLVANDLISEEQHGFVSGKSCVTQLLESVEDWTSILDNKGCLDVIYFDFQKAFDTVPHQRLAYKLQAHGIRGKVLDWIRSFLTNRTQQVFVNGCNSSLGEVASGVPQGSVLGPMLFVIYINDLPLSVKSTIKLFADDTKLYRRINSIEDCQILQRDIEALESWSHKWLLKFHPNKCKVMRIGRGHPDFTYVMKDVNNHTINLEETTVEKDLGVQVDNKLSFRDQALASVKKANQKVGLIRRSFSNIDRQTLPLLFRSLVRPHLEYAITIWSPRLKADQDLIEQVQKRATRLVPGLADLPYPERLRLLKLPSLTHRRLRGDLIEMYKLTHGIYNIDTSWLPLRGQQHHATRGHQYHVKIQYCNLEVRKNCFSLRAAQPWNNLPEEVVQAPSVNAFKARLDKYWSRSKTSIYD